MSEAGRSRVLVIGGTRGAGLLIARRLYDRGFQVRVLARDPARASAELGPTFEVVTGDLGKADSLRLAVADVNHIIFTAGAPSGRYAPESLLKATDYQGVVDTLQAARQAALQGRFVYLN
ncbi:MAG: NAD(P)H-binding protein [Bradyrhizobium sp.]|nr:NAD(P)H-binding protein [Bradyrhizobium sp.]